MLSQVPTKFFALPANPNCAQKVLIANKEKFNVTDREIALAKNCGGGKADGNLCGALYIALTLIEDPAKQEKIRKEFAAKAGDESSMVSRGDFNRIFKVYKKYEDFLKEHEMTNGEIDIAYRIIRESYENHMKNHTFIEDIRGYDI